MNNTKTLHQSESVTIENVLPLHIIDNNKQFVKFLIAYYDWMEHVGGTHNLMHRMGELHAIDFSPLVFRGVMFDQVVGAGTGENWNGGSADGYRDPNDYGEPNSCGENIPR